MEIRRELTSDFYNTALEWWKLHEFNPIPEAVLPRQVFILNKNGKDTHCIFPYETDSVLLFLAYPISNKNVSIKERKGGVSTLVKGVEKWARTQNYHLLFTTTPLLIVEEELLNSGFVLGDIKVTQLFKPLV